MIDHKTFLPKDRNDALFVIKHELMWRLIDRRAVLKSGDDEPDEYVEGLNSGLVSEITFLETMIDMIERS